MMKRPTNKNTGARKVFERIVAIAIELTKPQGVSAPELARQFEVTRKTIQRDLDWMRDSLLLEIEYSQPFRSDGVWRLHTAHVERIQGIKAVFANLNH